MNLEQRVQVLEQEVQLLKAQIQATLLDMQEQLLNSKYPILRAEEPVNAAPPAAHMPAAAPAANASPIKRVVLTEAEPEEPVDVRSTRAAPPHRLDDDDTVPSVVKVRSNGHYPAPDSVPPQPSRNAREDEDYAQPRASRVFEPPKPVWAEPVVHDHHAEDEDARDWIELENWVSQKVEKLGISRTRELINLYTRQERFSRQERELLLQFVNIYGGASKTSTTQKPKAAVNPSPAPTARPNIVPQTRAVVEEIRNELRQKRSAAKNKTESYHLSEQQELVMRLIAGILNAGDDDESSRSDF